MGLSIAELEALIDENGTSREQKRLEVQVQQGLPFAADLVFQEDSGFELWLGSLDDALSIEALEHHSIDAILNCAVVECQQECACSRPSGGGRRRTHARGPSAMKTGGGCQQMDQEQIKALACFDAEWYSMMLGRNIKYLGIAAADEPGYAMDKHFAETQSFLADCRKEGRRVLVHCVAGINRSSAALVAFLCGRLHMGLDEAIELTSQKRGHILSNVSFLAQLLKCFDKKSLSTIVTL